MNKKLRILIEIGHPAHVHFFKNIITLLKQEGHKIIIVSRDKDITNYLLTKLNYSYRSLTKQAKFKFFLIFELFLRWIKIFLIIRKEKINLTMSISGISTAVPSWFNRTPAITFTDTEDANLSNYIAFPFSSEILVPESFLKKPSKKLKKYPGYHELAYMHPTRYVIDKQVLSLFNLTKNDQFIIIRLVNLKALHDKLSYGIKETDLEKLIIFLEQYNFKILITSERQLSEKFSNYLITSHFNQMTKLLYFTYGYIGESPTMAMETALLGKLSIWISPRIHSLGYTKEMESRYHLLSNFSNFNSALPHIQDMIKDKSLPKQNQEKLKLLLRDKVDVSQWVTNYIISKYTQGQK